jgi:multicomponent Na+:H+ antiporter subunit F
MSAFYMVAVTVLLANMVGGLVRIVRGPTAADRMMAAQLLGTTGVAMLLLMAQGLGLAALRDVGMVLALLAVVATVAFVQRAWSSPRRRPL